MGRKQHVYVKVDTCRKLRQHPRFGTQSRHLTSLLIYPPDALGFSRLRPSLSLHELKLGSLIRWIHIPTTEPQIPSLISLEINFFEPHSLGILSQLCYTSSIWLVSRPSSGRLLVVVLRIAGLLHKATKLCRCSCHVPHLLIEVLVRSLPETPMAGALLRSNSHSARLHMRRPGQQPRISNQQGLFFRGDC